MSNLSTTQGAAPFSAKNRTSLTVPLSVPANSTMPLPVSGTQFYLVVATDTVDIRPSGGVFNTYSQGKGLQLTLENAFSMLEIKNDHPFPVVVAIFVGFDDFIDKTLIINQSFEKQVAYPTYPTANAAASIDFVDLSGQLFQDINGNEWFALSREAIYVSNLDTGVTLLLAESGATNPTDPATIAIFPTTSLRYPTAGDFTITTGGGNINAIASEIYYAIPKFI
jgi:hypothetical protein